MQSADGGVEERAWEPLTSRAARGYLSPLRSAARGEVYGRCAARGERHARAEARRPGGAEPGCPSGSTAWPRVDLPFALPGATARLPECANRHRKKVVGKGHDGLAVVQHHAGNEAGACGRLQLPYPAEIGCGHR